MPVSFIKNSMIFHLFSDFNSLSLILRYIFSIYISYKLKAMGKIGDFLRNRDRDPYPSELYFSGKKQFRTKTGGIISLIILGITLVIISLNLYEWASQTNMNVVNSIAKDDFSNITIENDALQFVVIDMQTRQFVKKDKLILYGLNFTIQKEYMTLNESIREREELVQCEDVPYFCIPPSYKFEILGRLDVPTKDLKYQRIAVQLQPCSVDNASCIQFQGSLRVFVYIFNNNLYPDKLENISYRQKRVFQSHSVLVENSQIFVTFYIKKANFTTDSSLFPNIFTEQKKNQTRWFYDGEQTIETYIHPVEPGQNFDLIQIQFKRSLYTNVYERRYTKLDLVLAQIFGLVGTVSLLLFCLYKGYNKWSYDQWRLQKLNEKSTKKRSLFSYYLSKLKCENNEDQRLIQSMDIYLLIKRVERLEERPAIGPETQILVQNEDFKDNEDNEDNESKESNESNESNEDNEDKRQSLLSSKNLINED